MPQSATTSDGLFPLSLSDAAILLPGAHFAATITNIYAYSTVYRSGMIDMISFSDVGNTAIAAMPDVYGSVILTMILSHMFAPLLSRHIPPAGEDTGFAAPNRRLLFWLLAGIATSAILSPIIGIILSYRDGGSPFIPVFAAAPWLTIWFALGLIAAIQLKMSRTGLTVMLMLTASFGMSSFRGGEAAQKDKYATYGDPLQRRAKCNQNEVLKSVGSGFLVLKPDGHQQIVDGECKARFDMSAPKWWEKKLAAAAKSKSDARRTQQQKMPTTMKRVPPASPAGSRP